MEGIGVVFEGLEGGREEDSSRSLVRMLEDGNGTVASTGRNVTRGIDRKELNNCNQTGKKTKTNNNKCTKKM